MRRIYQRWRTRWSEMQLASLMHAAYASTQMPALCRQVAELQLAIAEGRETLVMKERELTECWDTVEGLRAAIRDQGLQIAEMALQIQDQQRQRAEMLASRSWRITRLLRSLSAGWQEWRRK